MKRNTFAFGRTQTRSDGVLITVIMAHIMGTKKKTIHFKPLPVKTLETMTAGEIAALEEQYGCRVRGRFQFGLED